MNRNFLYVVIILTFSGMAFSQNKESRDVDSFRRVQVSEGIDVYLKQGNKEVVRVDSENLPLERVITRVTEDGTLKIHLDGNNRSNKITVYVTYVKLNDISASSAAGVYSESVIKTNRLDISASSAASIEVEVEATEVEVSVSSSGEVELKGKVHEIEIHASSAGEVDAYDLDVNIVEAKASSAGSIKITANEEIYATASSGGSIRYKGSPKKSNTASSSGGWIRKTMD